MNSMAESDAEGKSPGAGGSAEAFGWMKLETSYLKLGKDYGYSGEALVAFVERKLTEATVPKYTDKQDIRRYLITFEAVVQQNGYKKSTWLLALRSTAMWTRLERVVRALVTASADG